MCRWGRVGYWWDRSHRVLRCLQEPHSTRPKNGSNGEEKGGTDHCLGHRGQRRADLQHQYVLQELHQQGDHGEAEIVELFVSCTKAQWIIFLPTISCVLWPISLPKILAILSEIWLFLREIWILLSEIRLFLLENWLLLLETWLLLPEIRLFLLEIWQILLEIWLFFAWNLTIFAWNLAIFARNLAIFCHKFD